MRQRQITTGKLNCMDKLRAQPQVTSFATGSYTLSSCVRLALRARGWPQLRHFPDAASVSLFQKLLDQNRSRRTRRRASPSKPGSISAIKRCVLTNWKRISNSRISPHLKTAALHNQRGKRDHPQRAQTAGTGLFARTGRFARPGKRADGHSPGRPSQARRILKGVYRNRQCLLQRGFRWSPTTICAS